MLSLGAGDLLFIDSTHVVRTGSELAHIYLELIPRLQPGVVIHIHDIYLPYLYSPDIYESMFDWQETTLVAALLTGNPGLRVLALSVRAVPRPAGSAGGGLPRVRPLRDRRRSRGRAERPLPELAVAGTRQRWVNRKLFVSDSACSISLPARSSSPANHCHS